MGLVPPHVAWARDLFYGVTTDGITRYEHTNGPVEWKDVNNSRYESITDCSGFINALLKKAYDIDLKATIGSIRPYARTYYNAILDKDSFYRILSISDIKIGDFIAIEYPKTSVNTGHIMMVNALPFLGKKIKPLIKNSKQWIIPIMDQSGSHGRKYDSRNGSSNGLGTSRIRIYADSTNNNFIGYTWSVEPKSKFIPISDRPLAIGRLKIAVVIR